MELFKNDRKTEIFLNEIYHWEEVQVNELFEELTAKKKAHKELKKTQNNNAISNKKNEKERYGRFKSTLWKWSSDNEKTKLKQESFANEEAIILKKQIEENEAIESEMR